MIRIVTGDTTIYLAAYRIFINIGTGFAIINYFGTKNIKNYFDANNQNTV